MVASGPLVVAPPRGFECVAEWHVIVEHILQPLLALPTGRVFCHQQTHSLLVQLESEMDAHDVYCICGCCGSERTSQREWVAFHLEALQGWRTFSNVSVGSCVPAVNVGRGQGTLNGKEKK